LKKFIESKAFTAINSIKLIQFTEDKNTEGSQNVGPLAVQPPDVALGQRNCFEAFTSNS